MLPATLLASRVYEFSGLEYTSVGFSDLEPFFQQHIHLCARTAAHGAAAAL